MRLDAGRAWSDAIGLLKGQREILLTVTGFFIMLPALLLNTLRPFAATSGRGSLIAQMMAWTAVNFEWIILVAVLAAVGRLTILILMLSPERPTVGEALSAGARLLIPFVLMDLLIGFMLLGGTSLFILPAFYVFGRTFLAEAGFVADRARSPVAGLVAGFEASHGNGWRIFLMTAVIYVAGTILTAAIGSVIGVLGALVGGAGLDVFLNGLVEAALGAGVSMMLVLVGIATLRQLADQRHVRSRAGR